MSVLIFVWEYVTSGGWRALGALPSMIAEGAMMAGALARDLAALPGVRVMVARDPALAPDDVPATVEAVAGEDLPRAWRHIARRSDAVWPIAPETGGVLEEATRLVLRSDRTLLGSRLDALAVAGSKLATWRHLAAHGLPAVPTFPLDARLPRSEHGWVVKPDDGAGAVDTHFFGDAAALRQWAAERDCRGFVVQPFIPGIASSMLVLAQEGGAWLLSCNRQHVDCAEGAFVYRGGIVGGAEERRPILEPLAERIAAALPGLWGLVGIDIIDRSAGPLVLEVNPRLTTSYVGLAESIGINPAALVLALMERPLDALRRNLAPRPVAIAVPPAVLR